MRADAGYAADPQVAAALDRQIVRTGRWVLAGDALSLLYNGISYVPQGREIFTGLSVGENLLIAAKSHGLRDGAVLDEVCALFPVLRTIWRRRGGDLSGGRQQLAIGRALMGRPGLLNI